MKRSEALVGLKQTYERAGYEVESMRLHRRLLGFTHTACLLHHERPYKTTTGESCRYGTGPVWALTKVRLYRKVDDIFRPNSLKASE